MFVLCLQNGKQMGIIMMIIQGNTSLNVFDGSGKKCRCFFLYKAV